MNDSEQSSVQLFWWIQEIIPHIEIHSTLHKKSMILNTALYSYLYELQEIIPHSNDWNYPTHWFIALTRVVFTYEFKKWRWRFIAHCIRNEFWIQLCTAIYDEFKKLSHRLRFIAHYIRNEWF